MSARTETANRAVLISDTARDTRLPLTYLDATNVRLESIQEGNCA
ncbi:Hypothetical protein A7982_06974 [Minicystis rosea]|nr:Hypothetical protein A7982_06974 [Minicystis rosea]